MNPRTTLAAVAVLLSTVACGGPAESPAAPTSGGSALPTTAPAVGPSRGGPLDGLDPCGLLTKAEAEQITGAQTAEPVVEQLGAARVCTFSPEQALLGVGIRTTSGLDQVQSNGNVVRELVVGRHQAKQSVGATGSCGIFLGVTASSRVDVVLNSGSPTEDPCPLAMRVAELVEPRLP
ncbi:uncharacterized protein DUF3558 [Saccharothrix saharensis]|uniref:Uncharacterized protein DUF3558 n=1 Tax=Saccharothrix saharensis TaxID=571190 RepID=A0A543JJP4_9PSEU|nr:DUF3558 domain-containing protein [Saccharothrix saharensis]TQM82991.1 uncharacterized protein DUF3558 [Saccharothrix saharensis]